MSQTLRATNDENRQHYDRMTKMGLVAEIERQQLAGVLRTA